MFPHELLNSSSSMPAAAAFSPKRQQAEASFSFPGHLLQQEDDDRFTSSDDDDDSELSVGPFQRFTVSSSSVSSSPINKPSAAEPAMTPSRHKGTVSSSKSSSSTSTASRPNMSASHSITPEMLRPHFEKPLAQVAKQFGICVTLLKKICRKHGISRWPHRQITGLRKSIASMEHAIGYFEGARRESYALQLRKQKNKLALLLEDPTKCSPPPAQSTMKKTLSPPPSSSSSPLSLSSSSWSPQQVSSCPVFPVSQPHQRNSMNSEFVFTPPPVDQMHQCPFDFNYHQHQPPSNSSTTGGFLMGLPRPQQQPAFYLPPLRTENRRMLPPIASLVGNAAGSSNW